MPPHILQNPQLLTGLETILLSGFCMRYARNEGGSIIPPGTPRGWDKPRDLQAVGTNLCTLRQFERGNSDSATGASVLW